MSSDQSEESAEEESSSGGGLMGIVRLVTPGFIRRNFAVKFGIALLIIGLSVGAVGFVGSELVKDEFHDQVNNQYSNLAASDADGVRTWTENNAKETAQVSRMIQDMNGSEIGDYLLAERQANNDWGNAVVVHYVNLEEEQIVASNDPLTNAPTSLDQLNETVVRELDDLSSGTDVKRTDAYLSDEGGSSVEGIHISYVTLVGGNESRALVYAVSPKGYAAGTIGTGLENGVAMVVNSKNQVIMEGYGTREMHETLHTYDQWEKPLTEARGRESGRAGLKSTSPAGGILSGEIGDKKSAYQLEGKEYVVGAARVENISTVGPESQNINWVALVHTNQQTAYGDVEAVSNQSLIATLIGVLFIGVFGAILGRNTAKSIDDLKDRAEEMEEGNLDVDLYSPRDDQIGQLYGGFASMRDALKQQIEEAEQARKEAEVSRAEAMEMSNYLQEKADEYAQIMQQCAAGDLTQRMDADGENEAMDRIASEFNEMIDELEKTTGQLKSFADEVETAGGVVQTSSESVRDASEQVADSIQKISDDAYDQKDRLQQISDTMDEIATDLEEFAAQSDVDFGESLDRIEEIATMLNDVVELSEETMAEAENVAGAAEEQAAELNEVTQRAEDLSRYARPLREVLDRFETESEHEFYFPTGPGSGDATMPDTDDEE